MRSVQLMGTKSERRIVFFRVRRVSWRERAHTMG